MNGIRLGLRENLWQFSLLVVVNAFVGAMVGLERSILPPLAEHEFQLVARTAVLSFIVVFGVTKAFTNYLAGRLSDRFGRKHVLVAGWLVAVPVPFLLMWAPSWSWVLAANALLGVSQGLTWSTTVIMKIDLAGPKNRGLAMGLNEFAGYFAVAGSALATGYVAARYGLRPEPFYLGVGFVAIGLLLSVLLVRETTHHVAHESKLHGDLAPHEVPTQREIFWRTSLTDRNLSSVSQAGLVNNLNDGMAWGLFPLFFVAAGMNLEQIGTLAAIYPATWGVGQLLTGAWSDRLGRKWLIAGGMWVQAAGIAVVALANGFAGFAAGGVLLGIGTAMVYPTLLAAIGDVAHPSWRASSVGVYRLWRDLGYAIGALLAGLVADALGLSAAMWVVAAITLASGVVVATRMSETLRHAPAAPPPDADGDCVEPLQLDALRSLRPIVVVDVRSPSEFAAGHVTGAVNVPLDALADRHGELRRDGHVATTGRSWSLAMTRTLFILNDPPYGTERSYNALRLAGSLARRPGEEVKVFLMGDAASCAKVGQKVPQGYYNLETMLQGPATRHGVEVGVCGSCMDARGITEAELAAGAKRSSLSQLTDWTVWAHKTLVF